MFQATEEPGNIDRLYLNLVEQVLAEGVRRPNRTGVDTLAIPSAYLCYDVGKNGPALLHTKKVSWRTMQVELVGFLNGITDKRWYQEHKCHIWDEWCDPQVVPYGKDDETKARMKACPHLGPVYGAQWRNFMGHSTLLQTALEQRYIPYRHRFTPTRGFDQVAALVETLKKDPDSRRMVVSAWNPIEQPSMALPPCHYAWQVLVINGELHLNWSQRSADLGLGIPYNLAFYGALLELLAIQFGYKPGKLTAHLADTHIYVNHIDALKVQLGRKILPNFASIYVTPGFDVLNLKIDDFGYADYTPMDAIPMEVAV